MTKVAATRARNKENFRSREGVNLSYLPFITTAVVEALKAFPQVNSSVDGDNIVYHNAEHIGIAVDTPDGLVVPVVKDVDRKGILELSRELAATSGKARDGKLALKDLQGGTFTITNGGTFGSLMSTPIVNPPQSAILGMHAIKERPIAENGQVVIAPMMYIALSYDHRIIDGKDAVLFLVDIKNQLENPHRMLLGM